MTQMRSKTEKGPDKRKHGQKIHDEFFTGHSFFNPEDQMQVKYEMLRRVDVEGAQVSRTVKAFGFSRVSFYAIRKRFQKDGLNGLIDKTRGPKGGNKLKGFVLETLLEMNRREKNPSVLAALIQEKTGVEVHPRTVKRALTTSKKNAMVTSMETRK